MEWKKSFYLFKTELIIGHQNGTSFPLASIHSPIQHIFRRNSFHLLDIPEVIVSILYMGKLKMKRSNMSQMTLTTCRGGAGTEHTPLRTHDSRSTTLCRPPVDCAFILSAEMLHKVKLPLVE